MNEQNYNSLKFILLLSILIVSLIYYSNFVVLSELTNPKIFFHWYNQDQYLLNYRDFGFIKRGLIGTIFNLNEENYKIISKLIVLFILFIIYTTFILLFFTVQNRNLQKYLILLSLSPFFFQQFGFDFGRFDIFGVAFFLLFIYFVKRNKYILAFELICPFLILIHEIHFFSVILFVVYIQILHGRNKLNIIYVCITSIIILIFLYFVGGIDDLVFKQYENKYWFIKAYFDKGHLESSMRLWTTDVFKFNSTIFFRHIISIIAYLSISFFLIKKNIDKNIILLIVFYFPCFIIGIDHARFLSLFILNLSIITLVFYDKYKYFNLPKFNNLFFLIIFLGPWGVNICLPILTIIKKALLYGTLTFH